MHALVTDLAERQAVQGKLGFPLEWTGIPGTLLNGGDPEFSCLLLGSSGDGGRGIHLKAGRSSSLSWRRKAGSGCQNYTCMPSGEAVCELLKVTRKFMKDLWSSRDLM